MKRIEIADQPGLGFVRILGITVDGIRYRLFRAAVTVAVIAVAIAFLMNIMSESLIKREAAKQARDEIEQRRLVHVWAARLTEPGTLELLAREVAAAFPGGAAYEEIARQSGLSAPKMERLTGGCRKALLYLDFLRDLDYARRRSLVYTAEGMAVFDRLETEHGWRVFTAVLNDLKSVRFVTPPEELRTYLGTWPEVRRMLVKLREARQEAIDAVTAARGGRSVMAALAGGDIGDAVREAGFAFAEDVEEEMRGQARLVLDLRLAEETVTIPEGRQIIALSRDMLPADVTTEVMWSLFLDRDEAERYHHRLEAAGLPVAGLSPERLVELARYWQRGQALERAERLTVDMGTGWMGLGRRMSWLLIVSMLVCGIGISNAMLMTVTERFREIATMKCLGALDGFIMIVFVLESCFLGFVGGILGSIGGNMIGLGRMWAAFGGSVWRTVPAGDLVVGMVSAIGVGIFLAAVAAVYPALKAARLAPMEAMRIE